MNLHINKKDQLPDTQTICHSHIWQVVTLDCDGLHEALPHPLTILLQNSALVTTRQVQDSERVLEQALLHVSVQICVRVVTGRVVYLANRQFKALVNYSLLNVHRTVFWFKKCKQFDREQAINSFYKHFRIDFS